MLLLYFRCEMLPNNYRMQADYDYYAIDIGNRPVIIDASMSLRKIVEKDNLNSVESCRVLFETNLFLDKFPPCNPKTLKLRQLCQSECPKVRDMTSQCFRDAIQEGMMISDFATLHDQFNCSDPTSRYPNVSEVLYDSQQSCYNVSYYKSSEHHTVTYVRMLTLLNSWLTASYCNFRKTERLQKLHS